VQRIEKGLFKHIKTTDSEPYPHGLNNNGRLFFNLERTLITMKPIEFIEKIV